MKKQLFTLFLLVVSVMSIAQKYQSGNVYFELVAKNGDVSGTHLGGTVESINVNGRDIDIFFNDTDGDVKSLFLKDIPAMASNEFRYMKDMNARNQDEFFVANLISEAGILVLLKASSPGKEMIRMRLTNIR